MVEVVLLLILATEPSPKQDAAPAAAPTAVAPVVPGDYPEASLIALAEEELRWLSAAELRLMRNEIFARHGHTFDSPELKAHFGRYAWYRPAGKVKDEALSAIERTNIALLERSEAAATRRVTSPPLFPVETGGRWGFIDASGVTRIPAAYDEARDFFEERAAVKSSGRWGWADATGGVMAAEWEGVGDFHEGLASACRGGKCGFVDHQGAIVIPLAFDRAAYFSEGLAAVAVPAGDRELRWGYVNRKGALVIAAEHREASSFAEGAACVADRVNWVARWGIIDRAGRALVGKRLEKCLGFADGLAAVVDENGAALFVDHQGAVALSPPVDPCHTLTSFSGGVAAVGRMFDSGMPGDVATEWTLIDRKGEVVTRLPCTTRVEHVTAVAGPGPGDYEIQTCDEVRSVSDGWVQVESAAETYFLDRRGTRLFAIGTLRAEPFRGPLARVRDRVRDRHHGYVDRRGKVVVAPSR